MHFLQTCEAVYKSMVLHKKERFQSFESFGFRGKFENVSESVFK